MDIGKIFNDIWQTRKFEMQVRKQTLLGKMILCRYGRKKQKASSRIYKESASRRPNSRPDELERGCRPIYG